MSLLEQKRAEYIKKKGPVARLRKFLYSTPVELMIYLMIIASVSLLSIEIGWFEFSKEYEDFFNHSESVLTFFFIVEYILKFAVAKDRWAHFRGSIIDLLAILPFLRYFRLFRGVRILRLLRVVRLIRLGNMLARRLAMLEGMKNFREVIIIATVFSATVLSGSIGIIFFERAENEMFQTLGDGLWWCVVTLTTVGYGDKYPITTEGKIFGGVLMLVGLSFYGLIAGLGSAFIIERLKRGSEWIISTFHDHTVILGANDKLDGIIQILMKQDQQLVVVVDDIDRIMQYPENMVGVIEGDFNNPQVLRRARVEHASTVIILSDTNNRTSDDADARSVMATLAVEQLNSDIKTIVESNSRNTAYHLRNAGVDEVLVSGDLTSEMLAFSTDHPGFSDHLSTLMRFAFKNKIFSLNAPERFIGKKIDTITDHLAKERRVLLGVQNEEIGETLNPEYVLRPKDKMICIEIL